MKLIPTLYERGGGAGTATNKTEVKFVAGLAELTEPVVPILCKPDASLVPGVAQPSSYISMYVDTRRFCI
jgi:hypothetical protein